MYIFDPKQYRAIMRGARQTGATGTEICGLIINTGAYLALVQTKNVCRHKGSFRFSPPEIRKLVSAATTLGQGVVGTFHSHPASLPKPGRSDVANAVDGSLMLIFDCMDGAGALWRIKSGRAYKVKFGFVKT